MDAQCKQFLNALSEHLDSISDDEFYSKLKKDSHPEVQGQLLTEFLDNPFNVDESAGIDLAQIDYREVYGYSLIEPNLPVNQYDDFDELSEAA